MYLSTVDRLVSKLRPVNALVEHLCERLLPNEVAHASYLCDSGGRTTCLDDWGCGVIDGDAYATYCREPNGDLTYMHCGCYW